MIINLYHDVFTKIAEQKGIKKDNRFKAWVKVITHVNTSKANGFAFEGKFVNEGTVELPDRYHLILASCTTGSRKYRTQHYFVLVLNSDGHLELTDIYTNTESGAGWALRIREQVAGLLNELTERNRQLVQERKEEARRASSELLEKYGVDFASMILKLYEAHVRNGTTDSESAQELRDIIMRALEALVFSE